jgi:hydrogenase maturation protein HypF
VDARGRRGLLESLLAAPAGAVRTSSAGRLFDAVASLLGLRQEARYEAQAAMLLEQIAAPVGEGAYPFVLRETPGEGGAPLVELDWRPVIRGLLADLGRGTAAPVVAGRFHLTMARMIGATAEWMGIGRVVLTGGCFQNAALVSLAARELRARSLAVVTHCRVPPNDGGLAIGQAMVAAHRLLADRG